MSSIADFDIASDLKVEFFIPNEADNLFIIGVSRIGGDDELAGAGLFTIGTSLLGGSDLLGDSEFFAFDWQDLGCVTASAEITIGGQVKDTLYFQPEPASATVTIQSLSYDPNYNSSFRPGTQMRIRLVRDELDVILFKGFVDSISGTYYQAGFNKLDVKALDSFTRYVNTRVDLLDTDTDFPAGFVTPYEQLDQIALALGTSMNAASIEGAGEIPSTIQESVIVNNAIYEAIQIGLGLLWLDQDTQEFIFIPRPSSSTPSEGTFTIGNNHDEANHLCMSDIKTDASQSAVFNSLRVQLTSDEATFVVLKDQDSIDLFGEFAQDVTINTTDETELQRWAEAVFNQNPTNLVTSVETPAINRLGTLTEAAFFNPGELVGVKYLTGVLDIDDHYTVTKVSHSIDVNNWFTTLDLWKEA